MRPRLLKVLHELLGEPGKNGMLIVSLAVGLLGIGTMLGTYAVTSRAMRENYLGSVPASGTVQVDPAPGLEPAVVNAVAALPGIASAERRATLRGRMRVGDAWMSLLLFVVDDFDDMRLNRVRAESGAWPPPTGTILVERTALTVMQASPGDRLLVRAPHGEARPLLISGVVHDPGLAPAWQEKQGYAYLTRATLLELGETQGFDELRFSVEDPNATRDAIDAAAERVARLLVERGHAVHELEVPPPRAHPHQGQMNAVLTLFNVFSFLTLVLGALVVAGAIGALMTRQIRQIGVMKAIGATRAQIAGLYFALVGVLAALAVLLAVPLGRVAAGALTTKMATLLNLELTDPTIPPWVALVQLAAGLAVPLMVTAIPILRGSGMSVRDALDDHGVSSRFGRSRLERWVAGLRVPGSTISLSLRNVFRHRARLYVTLGLLAAGGAMFMSALNLARMWEVQLSDMFSIRHDDVELRLAADRVIGADTRQRLEALPGVAVVELWNTTEATFQRGSGFQLVRTYPDKSHGGGAVASFPLDTRLWDPLPVVAGRWLDGGEREIVLNAGARAQVPGVQVGDEIHVGVDGGETTWRVVGFVEHHGTPSATAYVSSAAYQRAFGATQQVIHVALQDDVSRPAAVRAIEEALEGEGARVAFTLPIGVLRSAIGDHMKVLVAALVALAVLMAIVGVLGLASTMSVNVFERTRELGVLRAIGASPGRIAGLVIGEGVITGALSLLLAFLLAIPLSSVIGGLIGRMAFRSPLPLALSPGGVAAWVGLVLVGAALASAYPAWRAARLTTRAALAYE